MVISDALQPCRAVGPTNTHTVTRRFLASSLPEPVAGTGSQRIFCEMRCGAVSGEVNDNNGVINTNGQTARNFRVFRAGVPLTGQPDPSLDGQNRGNGEHYQIDRTTESSTRSPYLTTVEPRCARSRSGLWIIVFTVVGVVLAGYLAPHEDQRTA